MSRGASISRMVLSDQVKDRLLQAILDGRYPPGARIIETRVARELGTSQAPVREALRDLEALGLVEASAFRGARVRLPSAEELLEAFVVRSQLESLAARLAVGGMTDRHVDEMAGYLGEMRRAARADDAHAEAMADAMFHGRIIELSGNATLHRVWRQLEPFSRTYITLVAPGADRHRIADLHQPVLDALRSRDAARTGRALDRHYELAGAMLEDLWAPAALSVPIERTV
ncbi:MAG: GntR family transcriptional regulator [Candidatus Limnocylindria bacterium]